MIDIDKDYRLETWEFPEDHIGELQRSITKFVLDEVTETLKDAKPQFSIDDNGEPAIYVDAGAFAFSIPIKSISKTVLGTDKDRDLVNSAIQSLSDGPFHSIER